MFSAVLILWLVAIVELVIGVGLLTVVLYPLQKAAWPIQRKKAMFVALGVLFVSPAIAPAGTLSVMPLPFGALLAFIRSLTDVAFLLKTLWFILPSMLITGFVCRYVAHRLFSTRVATA